jgi:predicted 3-demethylubiquinone-9 3-methyltransferase (glyoxalase superfamily)
MQKVTPFLWFDSNAEEAARFYTSVFRNSQLGEIRYYGNAGPKPAGSVMSVSFTLEGAAFIALNGGPHFSFTPAVSFFVRCETQTEVDELWDKLTEGGEPVRCG